MRRVLIALAVVSLAIVSSSSASAGIFNRKSDCCNPAPACCEPAPAPVCDPAPSCCGETKRVGLLARLHANLHSRCHGAPSCCEPAPAPAPCCEPAPSCCGETKRVGLLTRLHNRLHNRRRLLHVRRPGMPRVLLVAAPHAILSQHAPRLAHRLAVHLLPLHAPPDPRLYTRLLCFFFRSTCSTSSRSGRAPSATASSRS